MSWRAVSYWKNTSIQRVPNPILEVPESYEETLARFTSSTRQFVSCGTNGRRKRLEYKLRCTGEHTTVLRSEQFQSINSRSRQHVGYNAIYLRPDRRGRLDGQHNLKSGDSGQLFGFHGQHVFRPGHGQQLRTGRHVRIISKGRKTSANRFTSTASRSIRSGLSGRGPVQTSQALTATLEYISSSVNAPFSGPCTQQGFFFG